MNTHFRTASADAAIETETGWTTATLISILRRWADERPQAIAYTYLADGEDEEQSLTFSALEAEARRIGKAVARFVKPGERAVLVYPDGLGTITGLIGCLYAGVVPVSGIHPSAPRSFERFLGVAADCAASAVIGPGGVLSDFQRMDEDAIDALGLKWLAVDRLPASRPGETPPALPGLAAKNGDLAVIQYTSGSTRNPRGVMLSHRNILHNLNGQRLAFGYSETDLGVSWLPFSHDMGLIGAVLMALYMGGRCIILSPSHFLEKPERWLKAIAKYRATISGGPNFAYDLCARRVAPEIIASLDLSHWAVAFNGAEPIRQSVLDRFAAFAAPAGFRPEALYPCYGLAEATLFVSGGARGAVRHPAQISKECLLGNAVARAEAGADPASLATLVGCGRSLPDQRVEIVDPQSCAALPHGRIGEIWVAGESISKGYFGRDEDNAALFSARLADGDGPFLRTGDLGFFLDGDLYITGRLRDLIVLRGKNYYPQDIEQTAEESHPALRKGASAAFLEDGEEQSLAVLCEIGHAHEEDAPAAATAIAQSVAAGHGISVSRVVLLRAGGVMKTPSGKIQRSQTCKALLDGALDVVLDHRAAESDASAAGLHSLDVESWLAHEIKVKGAGSPLTELGFDSLKLIELKTELERSLRFSIPASDLYRFNTLGEFSAYLSRRIRERDAPQGVKTREPSRPVVAETTRTSGRLSDQRRLRVNSSRNSLD